MGLKPFISFLTVPLWGIIVDRFHISKLVLILSMTSLCISITSVVFIKPPKDAEKILLTHCNKTDELSWSPWASQRQSINKLPNLNNSEYYYPKFSRFSGYPWLIDIAYDQNETISEDTYTANVNASFTFTQIFILLLIGTIIGCPSLAIVDTLTLKLLGDQSHKYGKQRLTGSLGWGLGAFIVGASLTATHKCILHRRLDLINYKPCFYSFGITMTAATIVCFWFKFKNNENIENNEIIKNDTNSTKSLISDHLSPKLSETINKASFIECWDIIKKPTYLFFLFTALLMGFEMAFIKTYLFWYLKDIGACQILFSIISAINCVAEVGMYFFVDRLILVFGHKGVIYLSLLFYSARLFYYAIMPGPWWVLIVELLPGFTTAAAWAACLSYVNTQCATYYKTTMQCILHSVHWGLGYGLGEVIGGILVHKFGAPSSFFINAVICVINLISYILIEKYYSNTYIINNQQYFSSKIESNLNKNENITNLSLTNLDKKENFSKLSCCNKD